MKIHAAIKNFIYKNKQLICICLGVIWFLHWCFFVNIKVDVLPDSVLGAWGENNAFEEVEDPASAWFGEKKFRISTCGEFNIKKILYTPELGKSEKGIGTYKIFALAEGGDESVFKLIMDETGLLYLEEAFSPIVGESEELVKIGIFHKISSR